MTAGILLIIVAVAGALFFGYQLLFNNLDQEEKAAIDDEVSKITQTIVDGIDSDTTQGSETAETETGEIDGEPVEGEPGTPSQSGEVPSGQPATNKDEIARIVASYENGFEKLKNEGDTILDRLVKEIKVEYKALKASDGGKVDLGKLASSYSNKAKAYESSLDSSVTILLTKMSKDLNYAGMPDAEINNHIKRLETEYEELKDKRQETMLNKAKEYL